MNGSTRETQSELDDLRSQLVARATARADAAHRAIDRIASLDAEILQGVLELAPAEVRNLHADDFFLNEATSGDLAKGIDRVFANLMGMAAAIRRRDASNDSVRTQIILLLDELQILHQQLDFLQKFLLATDLLSELARSAYANKYRSAGPAKDTAATELSDSRAGSPAASVAPSVNQPSAAKDIIVTCGHCEKQFAAPESLAGKQVKCLNCQRPLSVPQPSSFAPAKRPAATPAPAAATVEPAAVSPPPEIPVACPRCRRRFLAQSWLAGKSADCPSCGQKILVPHEGSQFPIDLAFDTDPLSGLPDLDGFDIYSGRQPLPTSRRTLPRPTYSARKPARRFHDDELPRWVWYAMGAALGLGALVLLVIVASSLWRGAHRAGGETELTRGPEPVGSREKSHGERSDPSPPADRDSGAAAKDSTSSGTRSGTAPEKSPLRHHTSPDGGYSILVPGPVTSRTQRGYLNRETSFVDRVELPKDTGFLEVTYADQPLSPDPEADLAELWRATAAAWRASATQSIAMEYKGHPARDIRFVSEDPLLATGRALFMAVRRGDRQRLYIIVRGGPEGCAEGDEAETIFQSFRVLP